MLLTIIGGLLTFFGLAGAVAFGLGAWSSSKRSKEANDQAGELLVKASRRGGAALAFAVIGLIGIVLILFNTLNF